MLADATIRDELVDKIGAALTKFRSEEDQAGMRIVNQRQFDRLSGYISARSPTKKAASPPAASATRRTCASSPPWSSTPTRTVR